MNFINLTRISGDKILINLENIAIVGKRIGETSVQICNISTDYSITVKETVDEVHDMINSLKDPRYRRKNK